MVARSTPSMFTIYCLKSTQCLMFKELTKDSPNKKILVGVRTLYIVRLKQKEMVKIQNKKMK